MAKPIKDAGMIQLLLTRLNEERLPQALRLKDKVNRGECLSEYELSFMKSVMQDTTQARRLATKYPEYQDLVDKVAALYGEITQRAAENEQATSGGRPL